MPALVPALVLFVFGLVLRLLFTAASPDGGVAWHIGFQGDAPVWQDLAARLAHGVRDAEFELPWRPPAMTYGVAWLWDGEGATVAPVRLLFTLFGAAVAPLLWLWLRRHVQPAVAFAAALWSAASSNLVLLSSGLHAEAPYLVLVVLSLFDFDRLHQPRSGFAALRWGVLQGATCLLRAEHVLAVLAFAWLARRRGARMATLLLTLLGAALPLVPWQLHANAQVARFNAGEPPLPAAALPWDDDALAELRRWPAFQQVPLHGFVTATVRVRGGERVQRADLGVVREAFGVDPQPLVPAFLALHGAFDFWLANTPEGEDAFTRAALDRPLPLAGGPGRYPADLRQRLPSNGKFSLAHPVHTHAFVHGYRLGLGEIAADPLGAARRIGKKLWNGMRGATGGTGGLALPIGLSGVRRPVDMVAAEGFVPTLWQVLLLGLAAFGLQRLRGAAAVSPLLAFAIARFVVIAAFFGHARHGALCVPLVALGLAALLVPPLAQRLSTRALLWLALATMVVLLTIDAIATVRGVVVHVDGQPWLGPAGGTAQWRTHTITFG